MENKINIAELLKDCPKGMELDCTMFENVTFVKVDNNKKFPIEIAIGGLRSKCLTKEGCFHDLWAEAKCVIFPKGKTTWDGFVPPCKFKVGDKIEKCGYRFIVKQIKDNEYTFQCGNKIPIDRQDEFELVPNKFDISTLKPFDRVLVRLTNNCVWIPKFFWHYDIDPKIKYYPFVTIENLGYPQCIPYEQNKHLLGTTNDCDEFFRNWE